MKSNTNTYDIALVRGDGSAPEMMSVACSIAQLGAKLSGARLQFYDTPMGWCAYRQTGDTLPEYSINKAVEIGTVFFGGVGDPQYDNTIGATQPALKPEARCLLPLRQRMGLLLNFRPVIYFPGLEHLAKVKPEEILPDGITQIWIRFLLEDSYFGNTDFLSGDLRDHAVALGAKLKSSVTGDEDFVTDISYYRRSTIEKYIRAAFKEARARNLPLISIDKANVMSRYDYWRKIVTKIGKAEFSEVPLSHQLVDSANALLFTPSLLHGVIACGNEHGDILSDGAAAASGSMGLMCSSSINPDTGAAMFESGAGTAPTLAGKNQANPIGRILTASMMLRHLGIINGANLIDEAVKAVLKEGYRTVDLVPRAIAPNGVIGLVGDGREYVVSTNQMGGLIENKMKALDQ